MARVGYSRVSTDDQHPEAQSDRLTADGCEKVFTDKGVSGRKASRPAWDECLKYLRPGDTLVVVRLDRMGRSVRNLIDVARDLEARGINLRVIDQGIDTSTPAGRFFFHVMAALSEMEADMIRERTIDGLAAARARGRKGGRKPKLGTGQVNVLRTMYEATTADGKRKHTVREIADALGISRDTAYAYLRGEVAGRA